MEKWGKMTDVLTLSLKKSHFSEFKCEDLPPNIIRFSGRTSTVYGVSVCKFLEENCAKIWNQLKHMDCAHHHRPAEPPIPPKKKKEEIQGMSDWLTALLTVSGSISIFCFSIFCLRYLKSIGVRGGRFSFWNYVLFILNCCRRTDG